MKGSPKVIAVLQAALPMEATLNEQYRNDEALLRFWHLKKLPGKIDKFGDDAHQYRRMIGKRLLRISGDEPATAQFSIGPVKCPTSVTAMFSDDLASELAICTAYEDNVAICTAEKDDDSRNLFEHLIKWHHDSVAWLEAQLRLIKSLGEQEYLAEKL
jgi:bacterioferritin